MEVVLQHDDVQLVGLEGANARGDLYLGMPGESKVGGYGGGDEDGRHKRHNIVSVEEATVVMILRVVPSISEVSGTGGGWMVKAVERKAYLSGMPPERPKLR